MCKTHWSQYTSELRKAALARSREAAAQPDVEGASPPAQDRGRKRKARPAGQADASATAMEA